MQQKRLISLKQVLMAVLILGISFGCKKSGTDEIEPTPINFLQNFVPIPATTSFMMDSLDGEINRNVDETQHEVALSRFYISKYK